MELKIRPMRKQDYSKAIDFAIKGMHFENYLSSRFLLKMYGRYFWYDELERATQLIAAYYGSQLAGVLIADMKGEKKPYHSFWRSIYVHFVDWLQNTFYKDGVGPYNQVNQEMLADYAKNHHLDGEICFLAADPDLKVKGIGTLLLKELERREAGKRIYLYTDNHCTYQFYEHRGFEKVGDREIEMDLDDKGEVPLSCYLYSKVCA